MDQREIMTAVLNSHKVGRESTASGCECGGSYRHTGQGLAYDPDTKQMVDLMDYVCVKCGKEKVITVPLQGATYEKMATHIANKCADADNPAPSDSATPSAGE